MVSAPRVLLVLLYVTVGVLYESLVWFGSGSITPRFRTAWGMVGAGGLLMIAVLHGRALLPPVAGGRFTPFGLGAGSFVLATAGVWALSGGLRRYVARDAFGAYFLLAAFVWVLGLLGF